MLRWTTLGLALLALCLAVSPVAAQKIMCEQTSALGFNVFAHNWNTTMNNLDSSSPTGGTLSILPNSALFGGPPTLMDSVHTCWTHEATRGGGDGNITSGRALGNGWAISTTSVCIGNTANGGIAAGPIVGPTTIAGWAETVANSDLCMAPFNANPVLLTGGLSIPLTKMHLGPGTFCIVRFFVTPQVLTTSVVDTYGQWHGGTVVYEVQHGYNGTPANQMYLGVVSINEATYPYAGGLSNGDGSYGTADGWPAGTLASSSRVLSFSTGYVFTLGGQSSEGACDGLDFENSIAVEDGITLPGKRNHSCVDGNGRYYYDYGDGGGDWTASNCDRFNIKCMNYYYGQLNNQTGSCPDPNGSIYRAMVLWSKTPHGFMNLKDPIVGQFYSVIADPKTSLFLVAPPFWSKHVTYTKRFKEAGLTGDRPGYLVYDGAWPAFGDGVHTVKFGSASFARGDNPGRPKNGSLRLCSPRAIGNGLRPGTTWYVGHLVLRKTGTFPGLVVDSGMDNVIHINY